MELSKKIAAIKGIRLVGHRVLAFFSDVPVAQRGLEPRTADVSDRNSNQAELLRNVIVSCVARSGLEPLTPPFSGECSTI
jgi:hypothetical protein